MTAPVPLTLPVEQFSQVRYRCPYCRRSWTSLRRANEHRDKCWRNPGVRGCKTCRHATEDDDWGFIDGCAAGVDLGEPVRDGDPIGPVYLRTNCPLWEALEGTQ